MADLNVHGGTWVVQAVVALARGDGFEVVESANEVLAEEAVEGDSEIEHEAMRWLPRATTELAVRALLAQPVAWERFSERLERGVISRVELERIFEHRGLSCLLAQPRVAIVGPPNVGKSTLANQLFGQERSITADLAGTTRDWVGEMANIDGLAVLLLDTPGRRATIDAIEREAIKISHEQVAAADLVIVVLDRSAAVGAAESEVLTAHPNAIVVANKSDRPPAWDAPARGAIQVVAIDGTGVDILRRAILQHFNCEDLQLDAAQCWTERQRKLLKLAMDSMDSPVG